MRLSEADSANNRESVTTLRMWLLLMVLRCGKVGAVPMIPTLDPTETTAESPVKTNSLPLMLLFCTLFDSSTPLPPI